MQIIRVITNDDTDKLVEAFRKCQQGITVVNGQGAMGPVKIIFTVVKRTNKSEIIKLIEVHSPNAFYSVEEVKNSEHGVFRNSKDTSVIKRMLSLSK